MNLLPWITGGIGAWSLVNGVLHDAFILNQDRKYDRDLLRLLMDGHILITCGAMQMLAYIGLKQLENWGFYVAGVACASLLVYCFMIFPFLKSFVTISLNFILLFVLSICYFNK